MAFILVTVLLDSIGFGIILPVLPGLIMDVTGEPLANAARYGGWLLFVYAVTQFFSAPVLGNLSDRFGRRPVLLLSLLAMGCDYLLMGWAPTLGWLFLGRLIAGISASTYGIANAFIADTFAPEDRARNFALLGAAFGVGFIVGPVIGGLLGEFGPRAPFYAAAGLAFTNVVYGFLVLPESLKKENRRAFDWNRANPLGTFNQLWRYPVVLGLVFAYFFYMMGHHSLPSVWSYFAIEKFDWSSRDIGISLGAVGVCMIVVQAWLIRYVLDRFGTGRTAYIGLVATILSFVGYALVPYGWMIYGIIVLGAAQGFVAPSVQALMSGRIPPDAQGELQGALASVSSLVSILSPPFMTQTFAYFSAGGAPLYFPGAPFIAAALFTLLGLIAFMRALVGVAKPEVSGR
ncbi:MAG: TCR/Tet family MFS transporter [Gammaproteobacteria bacterium]|nr:TCR/Tet family MFS transporter [Gammaproteobacteria bacterium]